MILARFIPVARTFVTPTAGIGRMDRRRFTAYNMVGAAVSSAAIIEAGFYFGAIPFVASHIELIIVSMAALSVVPAGLAYLRNRSTNSARTAEPQAVLEGV